MRRTAGDGLRTHGARWVALIALVVLLVGCGGGGDPEEGGSADLPPSSSPDAGAGPTSTTATTTTTTTSTTEGGSPDGVVDVPIEAVLVQRLPNLGYERTVSADSSFDVRLCDGEEAPTVPIGQAEAVYDVGPDEVISIAGYRFAEGVAPYYISLYTDAVSRCAVEAGERTSLGLTEGSGFAFGLITARGEAYIAVALADDVMWVLFQETTDGEPTDGRVIVDESVLAAFARAVES